MEAVVCLISQTGIEWAGCNEVEADLLIYCSDGILAGSQIQLAAASTWLRQLFADLADSEENRFKSLLLPFVTTKQMKQVLELICNGSVILRDDDISNLVEISSLLGCIGDMLKEPVEQEERIGIDRVEDEQFSVDKSLVVEFADPGAVQLQRTLLQEKSVENVLNQIHNIQQQRMKKMEIEEGKEKNIPQIQTTAAPWYKSDNKENQVKPDPDPLDSDDFVVSDSDSEASYGRREYSYKRKKKIKFDLEEFEEALIELCESTASREGASVQCGLCDKTMSVPEDKRVKARLNFFKKNHYNRCLKKRTGDESEVEPKEDNEDKDDLIEVYNTHVALKEVDNYRTAQGRRKADIPPLDTIRSFLTALGGAKIVNKGNQIKCGLCNNKLRVNIGRTIMGNIRYFERTHLLRCPVRILQTGKPTELISESFLPGRTPATRVLKAITVFDMEKAELVSQLMGERDADGRRLPGRPRKGEEVYEPSRGKRDYYVSKRKQCLAATCVCFTCAILFDSGAEVQDHFNSEHPDQITPFYCLACQESFKTYDDVTEHLDTDHNYKNSYTCPFCDDDEFITQSKLNRHISEQHPDEEMLYTCSMCTKGFSSFHALKSHQKSHYNIDPEMMVDPKLMLSSLEDAYTCRFCGLSIMYGKHLDQHIRGDHSTQLQLGEKAYHCRLCTTSNPGYDEFYHYEEHLRNHGITTEHICRFCRKAHYNRNKFIEHFKENHPGEAAYECPRMGCEKTFAKKQKLLDHIILHKVKEGDISDDMKKLCIECGKVFYVRKKLEQHIKLVHGGLTISNNAGNPKQEKKHQCHLCVKTFSSNSLLQGHIRKHENNPCFMCDHCGKGFYRKDRLAVHTRSVHLGQKNFQCELCEKKFIDSYKLRRHMKTHTSGRGAAAVATAAEMQTVAIVSAPAAVSYETIGSQTIVRKIDPDADQGQVTIHEISGSPAILQVTTQPHIAKRTTYQNFIKFEGEEVVEDPGPVDFTQQSEPKMNTHYILSTQSLYPT